MVEVLNISILYSRNDLRNGWLNGTEEMLALNQTHSGTLQLRCLGVVHVRNNHS